MRKARELEIQRNCECPTQHEVLEERRLKWFRHLKRSRSNRGQEKKWKSKGMVSGCNKKKHSTKTSKKEGRGKQGYQKRTLGTRNLEKL